MHRFRAELAHHESEGETECENPNDKCKPPLNISEDAASTFASRIDAALADARASRMLIALSVVLRVRRWFRSWFRRA